MAGANSCLPAFRLLGVAWEDDILTLLRYRIDHTIHLVMFDEDDKDDGEDDDDDCEDEGDNKDYQDALLPLRTLEF